MPQKTIAQPFKTSRTGAKATAASDTGARYDQEAIDQIISRRHPEYADLEPHWNFCWESYAGGRSYVNKSNLFQFYKEGNTEFEGRLKRTYRANHTRRVVQTVNEYLFKQAPQRASERPDLIKRVHDNITRNGKPANAFAREVDQKESVYGVIYVIADRPAQQADSRSEEALPYFYIVPPTHMVDFGLDDDGNMTWALVAEDYREDAGPTSSGEVLVRYRLWTKQDWTLFTPISSEQPDKFELSETGIHDLGVVPIYAVKSNEGTDYSAPALVGDVAYMDRTVMNYGALLDEIIYEQTFSQLTMPAEAVMPGTEDSNAMVAAAKNRIFLYSAVTPGAKPEYISPDASQAELIIKAMQVLMKNIYAITGTDNDANSQSMSKGKEYASGSVRAFDHASIENLLKSKAKMLEDLEDWMMAMASLWMGDRDTEIDLNWVRYPESFDVRGLMGDLEVARSLFDISGPAVVLRQQMKNMVEKLFPRLSPEEADKIKREIDTWEPEYNTDSELSEREVAVKENAQEAQEKQAKQAARQAEKEAEKPASKPAKKPDKKPAKAAD